MPLENTIELLKEKEKGILLMLEIELVVISHDFSEHIIILKYWTNYYFHLL